MNHNHELPSSPRQSNLEKSDNDEPYESPTEPINSEWDNLGAINYVTENTENEVQEKTAASANKQKIREDTQKVGKKTLKALEQKALPTSEALMMSQLAKNIGVSYHDIGALLKTEGYEDCGIRLDQRIYFTEDDAKRVTSFFKDKISTTQLAKNLGADRKDIGDLLKTEGYEDCGIRLNQGIYFTKEDVKRVASFFEEQINTKQLAKNLGVNNSDISVLLKTEGYEDCGIRLGASIYFTEENAKRITSFFKDRINTKRLAKNLRIDLRDISDLLKTEGYEDCGIRLSKSIYFTEEETERVTSFFKDRMNTRQLAKNIGANVIDISALLKTEGYEDCGIRLGKSNYFTKEDAKRITSFFEDKISTTQLARNLRVINSDISALLKTEGYEDCGIRLYQSIYFTEEDAERVASFFEEQINRVQLAKNIGVPYHDIGALLKTEGYEDCGIRLGKGIYLTEEEAERVTSFFKDRMNTRQLAKNLGVHHGDLSVILKTEGYEDCGTKLGQGIYFTEEDAERVASFFKDKINANQLAKKIGSSRKTIDKIIQAHGIKGIKLAEGVYYNKNQQVPEIVDLIEHESPKDSFPETAIRFYLQRAGLNARKVRPDWMKREETGYNLEIDMYIEFDNPPPPGVGIEYDGEKWHPNPEYDASKNDIAAKSGIEIIHVREKGCPPMRDDIPCIIRKDQKQSSLEDCIRQVFEILHLPLPETGIDVSTKGDRAKILELAINKKEKAEAYKSIQTSNVNYDGIVINNTSAA